MPKYIKKRKLSIGQEGEQLHNQTYLYTVHSFQVEASEQTSLLLSLQALYTSREMLDVTFLVGGLEFSAHRVVLAAATGFFSAILRSSMQESSQSRIEITTTFDPSLFQYLIDYIYGLAIVIPSSSIPPLLGMASSFSMIGLRNQLASQLGSRVTLENCCSIFAVADTYHCEDLKKIAMEKIFSNFASVAKTSAFSELSSDLIEIVLSSDDILDCDEFLVFEAAVRWLEMHTSQGDCGLPLRILSLVRFPLMDSCLLSDVIKKHPVMQVK